jgi:hypothetical protein
LIESPTVPQTPLIPLQAGIQGQQAPITAAKASPMMSSGGVPAYELRSPGGEPIRFELDVTEYFQETASI